MTRTDAILWAGRVATVIFTAAIAYDAYADGELSETIRRITIAGVGLLFLAWAIWQIKVAKQYDGWPLTLPLPFRWVFAVWLMSFFAFIAWVVLIDVETRIRTPYRSAFMWWQFGASTLWVFGRWVTVDAPHEAGIGETGHTNGNGGA